jgi:hypothetical protein
MQKLSDVAIEIGRELIDDLSCGSPLYRAIRDGTVSREAYGAWLIQSHKYMRWTCDLLNDYARAMAKRGGKAANACRVSAEQHEREERGHDANVILDIATVLGVSTAEARARIESTPTAPAVHLYAAIARTTLAEFPMAFAGFATVMESLAAALSLAALESFRASPPFEGARDAIRVFADHVGDAEHVNGARFRLDRIEDVSERVASIVVARATKVAYRGLFEHLDAVLGPNVESDKKLTAKV